MNRRRFVRTIVAGATAAGVPFRKTFSQAPEETARTNRRHIVREPAHRIRDGHRYPTPPPAEFKDVVVVGAGPNSLVAAYHLPDQEVLCLEKEPRCGGNAQRSKWRGIWFTEGAAYTRERSPLNDFMSSEFGIAPTPIRSNVGYIVDRTIIPDFYQTGFDKLPYDKSVRAEFVRFRNSCDEIASRLRPALSAFYAGKIVADAAEREEVLSLETTNFESWLQDNDYAPEVIEWCDSYCPTDGSAYPRDISALAGVTSMSGLGNYDDSATFPGGLAAMAEALEAGVRAQGANRIRNGAFVTSVVNTLDGRHVDVTYMQAGIAHTVRCKTCIWGGQKHIAAYVVQGMPDEQKEAIAKMRYNDICVMNMCFDRRIYDGALITWMNDAPINNILSADWVLNAGDADPASPQVLTCDWANRPELRALLLDDAWVVEQCQASARRLDDIFPGSLDHLVEIRLPLRAHSWVSNSPGYLSELRPVIANDVGRVIVTRSDHGSFMRAYTDGLENAAQAREWMS